MPNETKVYTNDEIRTLWPQAAGELSGFQNALQAKSGLTAAQLSMALQLAQVGFDKVTGSKDQSAETDAAVPAKVLDQIEAVFDRTITRANVNRDVDGIILLIPRIDDLYSVLKEARIRAGRPTPKL